MIDSIGIYLALLTDIINDSLKTFGIFPNELKLAEVIALLKKADPFNKTNYRPLSLIYFISKVYERISYNQINEYIKPFLSKILTGFCENHNTHDSLFWKCQKILRKLKMKVTQSVLSSTTYAKRLIP